MSDTLISHESHGEIVESGFLSELVSRFEDSGWTWGGVTNHGRNHTMWGPTVIMVYRSYNGIMGDIIVIVTIDS